VYVNVNLFPLVEKIKVYAENDKSENAELSRLLYELAKQLVEVSTEIEKELFPGEYGAWIDD